jgi:hypothetical protein
MSTRALFAGILAACAAFLSGCSGTTTVVHENGGATSAPGPTPTPGPVSLSPAALSALQAVPAPGSNRQPAICPSGSTPNVTCFQGNPTEIIASQPGYAGSFSAASANGSVAGAGQCSADSAFTCVNSNDPLVYPQTAGQTTVTVNGGFGFSTPLPVTVTQTDVDIVLQNLPSASSAEVKYQTATTGGNSTVFSIASPATNPTLQLINVPVPAGVTLTSLQALVFNASGTQIGVATQSNVTIPAGQVNTETITVSPTTT